LLALRLPRRGGSGARCTGGADTPLALLSSVRFKPNQCFADLLANLAREESKGETERLTQGLSRSWHVSENEREKLLGF
jgi:hypothetical protein